MLLLQHHHSFSTSNSNSPNTVSVPILIQRSSGIPLLKGSKHTTFAYGITLHHCRGLSPLLDWQKNGPMPVISNTLMVFWEMNIMAKISWPLLVIPVQSAVATFIQDKKEVLSCWRSNSCQDKKDHYLLPLGACSHRYCCQQRSLKYAWIILHTSVLTICIAIYISLILTVTQILYSIMSCLWVYTSLPPVAFPSSSDLWSRFYAFEPHSHITPRFDIAILLCLEIN